MGVRTVDGNHLAGKTSKTTRMDTKAQVIVNLKAAAAATTKGRPRDNPGDAPHNGQGEDQWQTTC